MSKRKAVQITVIEDRDGRFFFAFGLTGGIHCTVVSHRHYKTKPNAERAARALLEKFQ